MTDYDDVEKALISGAQGFFTDNSIALSNVAKENRDFDPTDKIEWFSLRFIPNEPEPVTAGLGGSDRMTGLFQIDFNVPEKTGLKRLTELEKLARAYFWGGKSITYGSAVVRIRKAGFNAGRIVSNFYRRSLTLTFYSDLTRSGA